MAMTSAEGVVNSMIHFGVTKCVQSKDISWNCNCKYTIVLLTNIKDIEHNTIQSECEFGINVSFFSNMDQKAAHVTTPPPATF